MCVSSRETPVAYTTLFLSLWVVGDRDPGLAGGPERRQPGGGQLQLRASTQEELGVPRHCPGPTTLDVGHAELVEQKIGRASCREGSQRWRRTSIIRGVKVS